MGRTRYSGPIKSTSGFEVGAAASGLTGEVNTEVIDSSGNVTTAGTVKGKKVVETVSANKTLAAADSGKVFIVDTDAIVITLPSTASGLTYTFINGGADGAVLISVSPAAADAVHGTTSASTNVVLSGVDDKDLLNTKATATTGDSSVIVGDGSVGWYLLDSTGIWASQT